MTTLPVNLDDVKAAAARIASHVHRTPVLTSRTADAACGARLFFKCETFQRVGAFKARGAFSRLTLLSREEMRRGVVAFSSGNHAQAVALAARDLGVPATIVMPDDAPALKLAATRGYGAEVILYDRRNEDREAIAGRLVQERGLTLVPPFDDEAVIAGQGTAALELLAEVPDLDVLVTPCGGAGLLAGTAVAGTALRPGIRVFGVEPEAGDDVARSLREGRRVAIPVPETIADSLQTTRVGERNFAILQALVEGVLTVSDLELRRAMAFLFSRMKLVVEPGGSAAAAALHAGRVPAVAGRRVGVVLSGGNVDAARFGELVAGLPA
ncbi:MAG TPA: pyridoxal-phosphate dependent enzyme [Thermoanaerobaculia bacterium]|nr:pyridoxal-phosphate dependent enzyme [Thermoanaerobaculia bacterium]HQN07537.1 pyridoxal-phosphate dependent enzyme [Thermoanaerobaculia bacterium]HQP84698.1 pyridoxal-phosphate dependent enzyme [Thermoanaerobaculia bacterium]